MTNDDVVSPNSKRPASRAAPRFASPRKLITQESSPDRGPAVRKLDPADPTELQAFLSGVVGRRRVLHATGALSEVGARLLMALVEQSVRKGCAYLRLDLDGVMAIDTAGLRARRQFQANMRAIGVTLRFADPHRRITRVGLRPLQAASPGVLA